MGVGLWRLAVGRTELGSFRFFGVVEVNQEAVDEPEAVNKEPYGKGWLIKVRLNDASELDAMLTNEAYDELIVREMEENSD